MIMLLTERLKVEIYSTSTMNIKNANTNGTAGSSRIFNGHCRCTADFCEEPFFDLVDFHILRRQKENNWSSVNPNSFREGSQANLIIGGGPQQNIIVSIPGEGRCIRYQ